MVKKWDTLVHREDITSEEGKPLVCSYCGSKAYSDRSTVSAELSPCYYVYCPKCLASGPSKEDREKAIEAWNTLVGSHQEVNTAIKHFIPCPRCGGEELLVREDEEFIFQAKCIKCNTLYYF